MSTGPPKCKRCGEYGHLASTYRKPNNLRNLGSEKVWPGAKNATKRLNAEIQWIFETQGAQALRRALEPVGMDTNTPLLATAVPPAQIQSAPGQGTHHPGTGPAPQASAAGVRTPAEIRIAALFDVCYPRQIQVTTQPV